jgi:hypothetical protein
MPSRAEQHLPAPSSKQAVECLAAQLSNLNATLCITSIITRLARWAEVAAAGPNQAEHHHVLGLKVMASILPDY